MFNRVDFKKSIFAVSIVFVMLFSPFFYSSSVFAESASNINLDLWKWEEECDNKGNVLSLSLTEYSADDKDNCENVVIPNPCDFFWKSSECDSYKNLKTVFISKSVMSELAKKVSKYNGTLRVSDTWGGTVTAVGGDWSDCFNFENNNIKEIDLSHIDTENIENMGNMFANCKNLETLNLSDFNTEKVKNMCGMFSGCENLEELNLSSFDTKNVVDMHEMFFGCKKLKQLDLYNMEENMYPEGTIISCQPKENYTTAEEKLNGEYVFTVKLPLVEGTDFKWPEAAEDLKYDGQSKELISGEFMNEELKNNGVKFEYALVESESMDDITEEEWSDQIPTATDIGTYKICLRINGGEKYQDVYYVNDEGNDYLKVKIYELELQEGEDYEFAKTSIDLKYDGKEKDFLSGGFVRQEKKK